MRTVMLGCGVMGESILAGVLDAGTDPGDVVVVEQREDRAGYLARTYGVVTAPAPAVPEGTEVLLVAVKPHDVAAVLRVASDSVPRSTVVVSVAAGLTTQSLQAALPQGQPVVRAMPNTPALVGQGVTAICAGDHADVAHLDVAESLLAGVGAVVRVPEKQMDAVAAVSGSGPAYVFLVAEAMIEAGVRAGLPRDLATDLTRATLLGSAALWEQSGEHPAVLRERVTSPGGTTAAALHALEDRGVRAAFLDAVLANVQRSGELAAG